VKPIAASNRWGCFSQSSLHSSNTTWSAATHDVALLGSVQVGVSLGKFMTVDTVRLSSIVSPCAVATQNIYDVGSGL
jgi:hypothetical protein